MPSYVELVSHMFKMPSVVACRGSKLIKPTTIGSFLFIRAEASNCSRQLVCTSCHFSILFKVKVSIPVGASGIIFENIGLLKTPPK